MSPQAATEQPASTQNPMRHDVASTSQASGVPVASRPTPPRLITAPESAVKRCTGKWRAMKTVQTRNAGAQPTPISTWPNTNTPKLGATRREHSAENREREAHQHRPSHAVQVDADADEELHRAEREVKRSREGAELLRREVELGLQRRREDRRDSAKRLAHRERGRQRQQHGPGQGWAWRRAFSGGHEKSKLPSALRARSCCAPAPGCSGAEKRL